MEVLPTDQESHMTSAAGTGADTLTQWRPVRRPDAAIAVIELVSCVTAADANASPGSHLSTAPRYL
jgi:hypothetical protein